MHMRAQKDEDEDGDGDGRGRRPSLCSRQVATKQSCRHSNQTTLKQAIISKAPFSSSSSDAVNL